MSFPRWCTPVFVCAFQLTMSSTSMLHVGTTTFLRGWPVTRCTLCFSLYIFIYIYIKNYIYMWDPLQIIDRFFLNTQPFHITISCTPCHHPLHVMSSPTKPSIYVFKWFSVTNNMYFMSSTTTKNILSYIMLFTNECCHVITLVFTLSHFYLKNPFRKFPQQRAEYHRFSDRFNLKNGGSINCVVGSKVK
jgi:hypothetical protein